VRRLRQGLADRRLSFAKGEDEIGLAMVDEIGDLGGTIVRIDRDAAYADGVQGQRVKHMLGPVLQQRRNAVADAVARLPVEIRQRRDALPRLAIRHLEARWQVGAIFAGRHGQKGPTGMRGYGSRECRRDGRTVHDLGHDILDCVHSNISEVAPRTKGALQAALACLSLQTASKCVNFRAMNRPLSVVLSEAKDLLALQPARRWQSP